MTEIKSVYKVAKQKNGLPHFGEIHLTLELTETKALEIIEKFSGKGFYSQGYEEVIPENGYDNWKKGIRNGITYAYGKLKNIDGLKVIVEQASGLGTDTNSIILGFAASRAILNKLDNSETESQLNELEELVYTSWNYELDSIPNFEQLSIFGKKLTSTMYRSNMQKVANSKMNKNFNFWKKFKNIWK